jgi:hypothetical protein
MFTTRWYTIRFSLSNASLCTLSGHIRSSSISYSSETLKVIVNHQNIVRDYLFRIIDEDRSFCHLFQEFRFYIGESVEHFSIKFVMTYFSCRYCFSCFFDWYYCSNQVSSTTYNQSFNQSRYLNCSSFMVTILSYIV